MTLTLISTVFLILIKVFKIHSLRGSIENAMMTIAIILTIIEILIKNWGVNQLMGVFLLVLKISRKEH